MSRPFAFLSSIFGVAIVVGATTAATPPVGPVRTATPVAAGGAVPAWRPGKAPETTPVGTPVEETITIDWRVLAGLDYSNGKATDTLKKLDGKLVRVPGFVVPLDDFQDEGAEFLLVPYYGACVHTPPPPPNQIVMVGMTGKKAIKLNLFDAVWMSGRLKIASVESPYGAVGYQLEGLKVEPYAAK